MLKNIFSLTAVILFSQMTLAKDVSTECVSKDGFVKFAQTISDSLSGQTPPQVSSQWTYKDQPIADDMATFQESTKTGVNKRKYGSFIFETYSIKANMLIQSEGRVFSDYITCQTTSPRF